MGRLSALRCPKCGAESTSKSVFRCAACGGILEAHVAIDHLTRSDFDAIRRSRDLSIWRWFDFLPVEKRASIVSLGEGNTCFTRAGLASGSVCPIFI